MSPFGAALRARGVDIWAAPWELTGGDDLVHKVFEVGLRPAAAVIVVLSRVSVTRPWVEQELSAAVVRRLEEGTRLIPVVIDGLARDELPMVVRPLYQIRVAKIDDHSAAVAEVERAIVGGTHPGRPPLESAPKYAVEPLPHIARLDRLDVLVLKAVCESVLDDLGAAHFQKEAFVARMSEEYGLTEEQTVESVEVLGRDHLLKVQHLMGGNFNFELEYAGLRRWVEATDPVWPATARQIWAEIAGLPHGMVGSEGDLAKQFAEVPRALVMLAVEEVRLRRLATVDRNGNGPNGRHYHNVSPRLRRELS